MLVKIDLSTEEFCGRFLQAEGIGNDEENLIYDLGFVKGCARVENRINNNHLSLRAPLIRVNFMSGAKQSLIISSSSLRFLFSVARTHRLIRR